MSYEFTKLSGVPVVDEFPEGANAVIETNGEIKRCPSSGGGTAWDAVILCETDNAEILENFTYTFGNYDNIANKLAAKQPANVAVMVYAASAGDEAVYQSAATHIQFFNTAEQKGIMLFAQQVSGSFALGLSPTGTITKI